MNISNDSALTIRKMDNELLNSWVDLLEKRTGIYFPKERQYFLETSIILRMKEINRDDFTDYFHFIHQEKEGQDEWLILVDRLTIHETRFFRHQPSLNLLKEIILPALFVGNNNRKSLKIWSAGCSTGEEVYTLAMVVDQFLQNYNLKKILSEQCSMSVTGMDISLASLAIAKKAVYKHRNIHHVKEKYLEQYFIKQSDKNFKIVDSLRQYVFFTPFNIMDIKNIVIHSMDIIFCQNVLIYFTKDKQKKILQNLVDHLSKGGYLVLGAGEILNISHVDLEKVIYLNALAFHRKK